jgi:hypothetical protein
VTGTGPDRPDRFRMIGRENRRGRGSGQNPRVPHQGFRPRTGPVAAATPGTPGCRRPGPRQPARRAAGPSAPRTTAPARLDNEDNATCQMQGRQHAVRGSDPRGEAITLPWTAETNRGRRGLCSSPTPPGDRACGICWRISIVSAGPDSLRTGVPIVRDRSFCILCSCN